MSLHLDPTIPLELPAPQRRRLLTAGLLASSGLLAGGSIPLAALAAEVGRAGGFFETLGELPVSSADQVTVDAAFAVQLLFAWGDPISDGPQGRADAGDDAVAQAQQAGMHHDGMHFFPFSKEGKVDPTHGLLCVNHEYTDDGLLHRDGLDNWSAEKVAKSKAAHGVSVIEIRRQGNRWQIVRPSRWARRITADTPCSISGPARAHPAMLTAADRWGQRILGTLNNCAMGVTPWGTYLTCEENFNNYFKGSATPRRAEQRYGITARSGSYRWHEFDPRFDLEQHPNEANRFGWVVEIDPFQPDAEPVKHTALGRFKHEGATCTLAADGRVVVYMGDDERFEYIYKFVSLERYQPGMASPNRLLSTGTLYVARFDSQGKGEWLPLRYGQKFAKGALTEEFGFANQGDVVIRCREAADMAGATPMDRPEWIAVHPQNGEVFATLTNNSQRGKEGKPAADAANPRANNQFGHIIRWRELRQDAAATRFDWEILCLAGESLSGQLQGDTFANPDGLWFDPLGHLWIQTDMGSGSLNKGEFSSFGNNQMLVADLERGRTHRFLTGPRHCELTGITSSPDGHTLFVNIQHPGESPSERSNPNQPTAISAWPANQFPEAVAGRPRSATLAISRRDGQPLIS